MRCAFLSAVLASTLACLVSSIAWSQETDDSPAMNQAVQITSMPSIPREIHDAMQSRNYADAIKRIETQLGKQDVAAPDYLLYLQGIAQAELKEYAAAIAAFERLEQEHEMSKWLSRSRFGRANVYVLQRQYIKAGEIYQKEAERLLSRGRKDDLSKIYLEFATRYFDGIPAKDPTKSKKPDFKQALTYYSEAAKLGPTIPLRQSIEFRIARCHEELKQHPSAMKAYKEFLDQYGEASSSRPNAPKSGAQASDELSVEATFRLASLLLAAKQNVRARKMWLDLLAQWNDKPNRSDSVNDFLARAEYRLAHTYGLPAPRSIGDLELGVTVAERFLTNHPAHELAAKAELEIAQGYSRHNRHEPAIARLKALIENPKYGESKQLPVARRMLGQELLAQEDFNGAIKAWRDFLDTHPTDPSWPQVHKLIVNAEYAKAQNARSEKNYDEARLLWQTFLNKYPLDPRASQVLFHFGAMNSEQANELHKQRVEAAVDRGDSAQSVEINDECKQLHEQAIVDWRRVVAKYPNSGDAHNASYMIGLTLEDKLGRLKEALESYKKVKGRYAKAASSRTKRLTSPQLTVVTERKFRSDEKPRIKLSTRNLKKVTVKTYRIDMVDYFRKMHLASGIETLDIALIDPDEQFEHAVDDYDEYQRHDEDVELPIKDAGVTAVTVSSEKLEATTMVIVSDLDMIVKSSRNELFLFVQNMKTGKPAEGVSVLASDGGSVFGEMITNADGIIQESFDELKEVKDLRVFAVSEGHMASTVNNLNGLDFAVGLTPRGYLYTDRPAYRSGQLVNIKGIVRWVDEDRLTFQPGQKLKLDVYSPRGRRLQSKEVALNGYGTINSNLILPSAAPQGDYRVHLHRTSSGLSDSAADLSFETTFKVTEYQLEPVQILAELDKRIYFRGDKVKAKVSLQYYYGTPLAGEEIEYQFGGDGETVKAKTVENGTVELEFETQRFSESQPLKLRVTYPERSLVHEETVYLATRGFVISATTMRPVFVNGESFETMFQVSDPAGKPVETKLKVEVFKRIHSSGKARVSANEKLVQTHELTSDPDTGEARQVITLDEAGVYFVRATGVDQFDNEVSGQCVVRVSGDKDSTRLRILADQFSYRVGDHATINLHWREEPALALLTFEGASVLGHRLVELKKGDNEIALPMESAFAPNFFLSAAVMQRNEFHTAQSEFRVTQRLNVVLKPNRKELKPGDDLTVQIEVTDPQGNPVAAELSLALVQTNLLHRFSDIQGIVNEFFSSGNRRSSIRQSASCTFRYKPLTRAVSETLLAESDRRATLEREVRALAELNSPDMAGRIASDDDPFGGESDGIVASGGAGLDDLFGSAGEVRTLAVPVTEMRTQTRTRSVPVQRLRVEQRTRQVPVTTMKTVLRDGKQVEVPVVTMRTETYQVSVPYTEQVEQSYTVQVPVASTRKQQYTVPVPQAAAPFGGQGMNVDFALEGALRAAYPDNLSLVVSTTASVQQQEYIVSPQQSWFDQNQVVNGLTSKGQFVVVNGRDKDRVAQVIREQGLRILPAMAHAETAFWDPMVSTNDSGQATVTITMPDRSTAWRLRAKGINKETLAGESSVDVITKKQLFGDMKLPPAFAAGDDAQVPVEVHSSLEGARGITVKLKTTLGDKSTEQTKSITMNGPGISDVVFPVEIGEAEHADFELTVSNGDDVTDTLNQRVTIRPYGFPVFETASGTAAQSTLAMIQLDPKLQAQGQTLEILIGADVNRTLLESVTDANSQSLFGSSSLIGVRCGLPSSNPLQRSASDALGGVHLLELIGQARDSDTPEGQAISGKVTAAVSHLVSAQNEQGGWSWTGDPTDKAADPLLAARIMWALSSAREAGFSVGQKEFDKGKAFLQSSFASLAQNDLERQTILLHAMAESGCGDFSFANRLYRERNRLSGSGLTHLALTLVSMNRKEMAADLIDMINIPTGNEPLEADTRRRTLPWMRNRVELQAMYLLALQAITPNHPDMVKLAKTVSSARLAARWPVEKANGPAIAALAKWNQRQQNVSAKYKLTIFVNDQEVKTLEVDPTKDGSRVVRVPGDLLRSDRPQRIEFDLQGRAEFSYSAILSGFVAADKIASTTTDWSVSRRYEPAQRMFDGRVVPRGFSVVNGSYKWFSNPLTQLPVGQRGEVTVLPRRRQFAGRTGERYDYLVLTEPIPAGCTILDGSVTGAFERYEIQPGQITFHIGNRRHPGDIKYTLVGYVPGTYRAPQSILRSFYEPGRFAVSKVKPLEVLDADGESVDDYKLTPDELHYLGKQEFAKGNFNVAHQHLTALYDNWQLDNERQKETAQWLFSSSLAKDNHGDSVKYFEILKEKFPEVEISFEDILNVAKSYRELGEYERSYLVYRATVEGSFERESQVAGFLNARGEFARSVQAMERLLKDYPAESYVATATYALAQETYRRAEGASVDEKLKDAGVTRVHLIDGAIKMLDHFVTAWPEDPADDQASFALATALLDLEKYESAIERSEQYAKRYPSSRLLDSFWYMIGYSHFELEHPQEALEMCRKVADATFPVPKTGGTRPADNRWEAIYIMGQIHHSLGRAAEAIAEYTKVKERFADATEAISFFSRKEILLDEVTTIEPDAEKKVELRFRNVAEAAVKVYRIDLMKFGLMQRNLDRITAINLAGIKPYHEETIKLGDGKDFRDRKKEISLPLKEEGAYLIVCRGENLYASGLAVVSPLQLLVQEDADSGRVRVSVKESDQDKFVSDVHVKVIGSGNDEFSSGETDLRGLFIADDMKGTSTVIAVSGEDRYAFYRGDVRLQGKANVATPAPNVEPGNDPFGDGDADPFAGSPQQEAAPAKPSFGKDALKGNIFRQNGLFQEQQQLNYDNLMNNERTGVKSKEAY